MDPIVNKICRLFSQEIELYGNELALGVITTGKDQQPEFQPINWQQASSLDELADQIHTCTLCSLSKSRNKFVFGVGNPHADMMVIGEAPGADEDRIGEPFVGKAGELLDKMLAAISMNREMVYIANILKCRPPQNRDPLATEMQLCKPYLLKQIELSKPKIILCLGRIAAHALLETTEPLAALRNTWFSLAGADLLVTYHPAALLRNQELKYDAWQDLKRAANRYQQIAKS